MPNSRRARRNPALLLVAALAGVIALVATTLSTPALATPSAKAGASPAKAAKQHDRSWRASRALARAQLALSPSTPAGERPDATLALRNLWLLKDSLGPADRAVADQLAARPNKPAVIGDANIEVHYDPAELNPAAFDQNAALRELQYVADTYANSGYRRPKSDKGRGGDSRTDIYLDQLPRGLYGYCTSDQRPKPPRYDVWAYCVLDNDYADFPTNTPLQNLQVTAAHEYYHATQFAYDAADDGWFLEATAAWAEDELYDTVNDNRQYLDRSPIVLPNRSIDAFEDGGVFHYGVWNFFRYMTEKYTARTGAMPTLLLRMWQKADSSKGPRKDLYSTQAINKALKKEKSSLAEEFTGYSAATRLTRVPGGPFNEGIELSYPVKPAAGGVALAGKSKKSFKAKLDHLTSATFNYGNGGGASKLKLRFKMSPKATGSRAIVVVYYTSGAVDSQVVKINGKGRGKRKVIFDATVSSVDVTLVNASQRYRDCYRKATPYACSGKPVDQNERAVVQGKSS